MKAFWLEEPEQSEITTDVLATQGVHYEQLPTDPQAYQAPLQTLMQRNGYVEQDEVALTPDMENLDAICQKFIPEHTHDDDEVRFVLGGAGIFDIRSLDDRWMRVEVGVGDLIVVPADRNHRFFLTDEKNIHCVRLFKDSSGWTPRYREGAAV